MKKIFKNNRGYSLLEMILAVAMFATIFMMVTSIYLSLVKAQRSVIATQTIQESMKFVLETMSKEMRTAIRSDNICQGVLSTDLSGLAPEIVAPATQPNKIFNTDSTLPNPAVSQVLYFMNKDSQCVAYYLEDDANGITRLKIDRDNASFYVTPDELDLSNLKFSVIDDEAGAFHSTQATVTIRVDVSNVGSGSANAQNTSLQTSITSRYYE